MITEKDIHHMATLCKLSIEDEQIPEYIQQIQELLDFAESIDFVENEETKQETEAVDFKNLREDKALPSCDSGEILKGAKHKENDFFVLRKKA